MDNTQILMNIISNIKTDNFQAAQDDCQLLPRTRNTVSLYATIGAIESQLTDQAFEGTKSAALSMADCLIGQI